MIVEERFYVGYSDINREMTLSNTSLLKFFENMACIHGAVAGESIKTCESRWFLSAYHVVINKRPQIEERVTVKTWSREMRGVSASREFEVYDEHGEKCITAISNWARTNAKTQKLERIGPDVAERYSGERELTNFDRPWIQKLSEPSEYLFEKEFTVERNFIDVNDHMNNVFYLDLAQLVLPDDVYAKEESREFEIAYRKAFKYGEKVLCCYAEESNAYFVTLKDENKETRAIIKLYK